MEASPVPAAILINSRPAGKWRSYNNPGAVVPRLFVIARTRRNLPFRNEPRNIRRHLRTSVRIRNVKKFRIFRSRVVCSRTTRLRVREGFLFFLFLTNRFQQRAPSGNEVVGRGYMPRTRLTANPEIRNAREFTSGG